MPKYPAVQKFWITATNSWQRSRFRLFVSKADYDRLRKYAQQLESNLNKEV